MKLTTEEFRVMMKLLGLRPHPSNRLFGSVEVSRLTGELWYKFEGGPKLPEWIIRADKNGRVYEYDHDKYRWRLLK